MANHTASNAVIENQAIEATETVEILYKWGASGLNDALCWERYGYWSAHANPPSWASETLTKAKKAAQIANPADCRYSVEITERGNFGTYNNRMMGVQGVFRVWDAANPWVEARQVGFKHTTEANAHAHYAKEFANHARLHSGMIDALIAYRETGVPTLESWRPASQWYFKAKDYRPNDRAYVRKDQPGVVCYETFDNPAFETQRGMIHVEIRWCKGEWFVECNAEGPNRYRRTIGKRLTASTYEEARTFGSSWVEQDARPFIARELANQVDYVEVEQDGKTLTGELFSSFDDGRTYRIQFDNPDAFKGWQWHGIAEVEKERVRFVQRMA